MPGSAGELAPDLLDRIRGCLLGGAIGDALGAPVEFWSIEEIRARCGSGGVREFLPTHYGQALGLITDDTQMTLFTVEGLIRVLTRAGTSGSGSAAAALHQAYRRWYDTQLSARPAPDRDSGWLSGESWLYAQRAPGTTCMTALAATRGDPFQSASETSMLGTPARNDSKGCGGVMRAAPIGFLPGSDAERFELACEAAALTHGHPAGQHSAGALAVMIGALARGESLDDAALAALGALDRARDSKETAAALRSAIDLAANAPASPESVAMLGEGWVGEEALAIATFAALKFPQQVLDALSLAATHSGDTDSTAAICGNILGAAHGMAALPADLAEQVEGRETILRMADDLGFCLLAPPEIWSDDWLVRYPAT